ncbi:Gfo/Idh/MocA family oxidoreductase [Paenibacillus doosanensis]|uniref:1,5-anhydro-D-fructose reductase n=1 Tax=Paenibacillus konkukensis TaxID=2020716 RepID=A0ABY4RSK7_9BACL|nr:MULTISPECIES: Gfo/Idh/MocA family oxidoreductase [Paenibacillus]MCS7461193.1 Gfo/Idh/MocA family oxidoreductase [Paenibacillus doosanensis]UQZ85422.1 1,5-anhydro-D-fructose reductase [Paenibacillus konkukensis]
MNPVTAKMKIGIIGCGNISTIYCKAGSKFDILDIAACADLDVERARVKAEQFASPKACSVAELLADPEIELVVNLTVPHAHADIHLQALRAGKHTYGEKPLAVSLEDGKAVLALARDKGLRVGSAPDTFLGGGLQTCRKLIDDGWIGTPVAATAFLMSHGPESWHPNPDFLYQVGAGPMFDMGPYYLTALVHLLGPVRRVTGSAAVTFPERTITGEVDYGRKIPVETPTHIAGVLDFHSGAIGTIITSFDVWGSKLPRIEIYGSAGTLVVPDPNTFGGPIYVKRHDQSDFAEIPAAFAFNDNSRGIGVADMAHAIRSGRMHRANGELAYHVLELMHGFHIASREGRHYLVESSCARPAALPMELPLNALD